MSWELLIGAVCPRDDYFKKRFDFLRPEYITKYEIARGLKPKRILEIGVRAGYSALAFLRACPNADYIGIDAENGTHGGAGGPWTHWAAQILRHHKFTIIIADTQEMHTIRGKFDMIHVDGDHSVKGCTHDLRLALGCLAEEGTIVVDDYDFLPEVKEAVDSFVDGLPLYQEYVSSPRGNVLLRRKIEE